MKVFIPLALLGDVLCTLPVVQYLIHKENENNREPEVCFQNDFMYDLMPENFKYIRVGNFENETPDYHFHGSLAWNAGISDLHMAQSHYRYANLPIPDIKSVKPKITFPTIEVEEYDFIISPYSYTDFQNNKLVPLENWQEVINYLNLLNYKIAVVRKDDSDGPKLNNVDYIQDKTIPEICNYLSNVKKGVLSIDSGISHLSHFLGVPHLLLYPACLPPKWVTNPNNNAFVVQDWPVLFSGERIIDLVNRVFINYSLSKNTPE